MNGVPVAQVKSTRNVTVPGRPRSRQFHRNFARTPVNFTLYQFDTRNQIAREFCVILTGRLISPSLR